jgi:hypothetical protein
MKSGRRAKAPSSKAVGCGDLDQCNVGMFACDGAMVSIA